MSLKRARLLAFYLPQYHPIPENDRWWGKGFTEWVSVARARPFFEGHIQPQLPGELGFYDLRLAEAREAQAAIAAEHGVEAFCYWHYWMGDGRRLLERPFEEVLTSGKPDFPFCLAWANHSWKHRFFGAGDRCLIEQTYPGMDDHRAHFDFLLRAFSDPRYLRVDGKPFFYLFLPRAIPNLRQVTDLWRELAQRAGLPGLYLAGRALSEQDKLEFGFDGTSSELHAMTMLMRAAREQETEPRKTPLRLDYRGVVEGEMARSPLPDHDIPCILTNWDTTPRHGLNGEIFENRTPELFREHVRHALAEVSNRPEQQRLIFIKSWNEWAEGNFLEPDWINQRTYLEILRSECLRPS